MNLIERQNEINYIIHLLSNDTYLAIPDLAIANNTVKLFMYEDIIKMIKIIKNYVDNNSITSDNYKYNNNITFKSKILRKTLENKFGDAKQISGFDVEVYSLLLYDILSSHEIRNIIELNNICKKINEDLTNLIKSKYLTIKNYDKINYRTIVEQMMFILNSFYTIIPEGYSNIKVRELIDRINLNLKNSIKIYSFALTPDGNILLDDKNPNLSDSYFKSIKYEDLFSVRPIIDILKPMAESTSDSVRIEEIFAELYDDINKYKGQHSIISSVLDFSRSPSNDRLEYIKSQADKFNLLKLSMRDESKKLIKYPHLELSKIISNPSLFEQFKNSSQLISEEDSNKLISSYFITFILDALPSIWSVDEYTSNSKTVKKLKKLYDKKQELLTKELEKVKKEKAILFAGTIDDIDMEDKYLSYPYKGSLNPKSERNLFFEMFKYIPNNSLIEELITKILKENSIVNQCIMNDMKFKALYIPYDESDRIEYDPNNLDGKVVVGMTLYNFIKVLLLLPNIIFQKFKRFVRTIFTYGNIVLNQSIKFIDSKESEHIFNNSGIIESLIKSSKTNIISGILKCRQDDWLDRINYRYKIFNKNKLVILKYTNLNDTNNILESYVESSVTKKSDNSIVIEKKDYKNELNQLKSSNMSIEDYNNFLKKIEFEENEKYQKMLEEDNNDDPKFKEYINAREYFTLGPYDYFYGLDKNKNEDLIDDLKNDFFKLLKKKQSICFFALGESGSGKTSTLIYSNINGTIEYGIIFLLLDLYNNETSECKIENCKFKFYNISKGDEPETIMKKYSSLSTIGNWEIGKKFYDVSIEQDNNIFIYDESRKLFAVNGKTLAETVSEYINNEAIRPVSTTINSPASSRSHSIISIELKYKNDNKPNYIFICDLAGSENIFNPNDPQILYKMTIQYNKYYNSKKNELITKVLNDANNNQMSNTFMYYDIFKSGNIKTIPSKNMLPRSIITQYLEHRNTGFNNLIENPSKKIKFKESLNSANSTNYQKNAEDVIENEKIIYEVGIGAYIYNIDRYTKISNYLIDGTNYTDYADIVTADIKNLGEVTSKDEIETKFKIIKGKGKKKISYNDRDILSAIFIKDDMIYPMDEDIDKLTDKIKNSLERYENYKDYHREHYIVKVILQEYSYIEYYFIYREATRVINALKIKINLNSTILIPKSMNEKYNLLFDDSEINEIRELLNSGLSLYYNGTNNTLLKENEDTGNPNIIKFESGYGLWFLRSLETLPDYFNLDPVSILEPQKLQRPNIFSAYTFDNIDVLFKDDKSNYNMVKSTKLLLTSDIIPNNNKFTRNGTTIDNLYEFRAIISNNRNFNILSVHYFLLMHIQFGGGIQIKEYKKKLYLPETLIDKLDNEYNSVKLFLDDESVDHVFELLNSQDIKIKSNLYKLFKEFIILLLKKHADYVDQSIYDRFTNAIKYFENNNWARIKKMLKNDTGNKSGFLKIAKLYLNLNDNPINTKLDIFIMYICEYCSLIFQIFQKIEDNNLKYMYPFTLKHINTNISSYCTNIKPILLYNCKYSIYEGYAINRAIYELIRDFKYISTQVAKDSYIELYPSTNYTNKCKEFKNQDSQLDIPDINPPSFGIIIRLIVSCILNKSMVDASDYLNESKLTRNEIIDVITSNLKIFTFTMIHYTVCSSTRMSVNNPPDIPFIKTSIIKSYIYPFKSEYKYYIYDKINNNIKFGSSIYKETLIKNFKLILDEIKVIFSHKMYEWFSNEIEIGIKAKKAPDEADDSTVKAYRYLSDENNTPTTILSIMQNDIDQINAYVNLIENNIISSMDNIINISLIGSLITTQSFINSGMEFICSTDKFDEDEY